MLEEETICGVIDDRGKFISITRAELEEVAKFIKVYFAKVSISRSPTWATFTVRNRRCYGLEYDSDLRMLTLDSLFQVRGRVSIQELVENSNRLINLAA